MGQQGHRCQQVLIRPSAPSQMAWFGWTPAQDTRRTLTWWTSHQITQAPLADGPSDGQEAIVTATSRVISRR